MVLAGGVWQARQVVPQAWLRQSMTPVVNIEDFFRYGWHWLVLRRGPRWRSDTY